MSSSFDPDTTAPSEPAAALDAVQRCFWVWLIRWQLPFQPKGALLLLPEAAQPWGAAELYPRPPGAYFSSFLRGHCLLSTRSASVVRKRISKRVCLCLTWTRTPPVTRRSQGDPSLSRAICGFTKAFVPTRAAHLELWVRVGLSDVGQQLSAGLAHVSGSLQQVLARLRHMKGLDERRRRLGAHACGP